MEFASNRRRSSVYNYTDTRRPPGMTTSPQTEGTPRAGPRIPRVD